MKVANICRKLARALAAGGILIPSVVVAAGLDTNLVENSGFENVNPANSSGGYTAIEVLDWTDGSKTGFAYSHNGTFGVADYANGGLYTTGTPFAGGGDFYFTSNATSPDVLTPGEVAQRIDLSTGDAAAAIAAGRGEYEASALFNTFSSQSDYGVLHLNFLNAQFDPLGSTQISPRANLQQWTQLSTSGNLPIGTAAVEISVYAGGGNDGYLDNVDFRVLEGDAPLGITVDHATGDLTISNVNDSGAIEFDFYEIVSPSGSLLTTWNSFEDQGLDATGAGLGQHWSEGAGVSATILSEVYLLGTTTAAAGGQLSLPGAMHPLSPHQDLVFRYGLASEGQLRQATVAYVGTSPPNVPGDFDGDGDVDGADWRILRDNQHADLTGLSSFQASIRGDLTGDGANNHADFAAFKAAYEASHGAGAFAQLVAAVPEPSPTLLVVGLFGVLGCQRRDDRPS